MPTSEANPERVPLSPGKIKPDVHRRLEKAVLEIFSTSDFHKANMREVAKKAGVSFSTIYSLYGSKERLLFDFVDEWLSELTERMIDHLQGIGDIKEKLRKVFWVQLDYWEKNPAIGRILFMTLPMKTWMEDKTFQQKKLFHVFFDVLRQGQEAGLLNSNVRPGVLIDLMYGLVIRTFYMWEYSNRKGSLTEHTDQLFEMVWKGSSK